MNRMTVVVLVIEFGLTCLAHSQDQPINPSGGTIQMSLPKEEDKSLASFTVASTNVVFRYPSELKAEDPKTISHRSYRMVFSIHPENDPNPTGSDPCSPIVFAVGVDEPEEHGAGGKKDNFLASASTGGITLIDVDRKCVEGQSDGAETAGLVYRVERVDGLTPVTPGGQVVSYSLDGHPAALGLAQGFSKDKQGKRNASAGETLVGGVSLLYGGHLFLGTFISNDVALFNRMLKSRVQFGDQPSWQLVPFKLSK